MHAYILELIVAIVFDTLMSPSSGPDIQLFKRFADYWKHIDRDSYDSGVPDNFVARELDPVKHNLVHFINSQLSQFHPRDDYRDLLELALLFLGESLLVAEVHSQAPGAFHRARWMAKVLYLLKIFLLPSQFHLSVRELSGLRDFSVFVLKIYLEVMIYCCMCGNGPTKRFELASQASKIKNKTIETIATAAIQSFSRHLWYQSKTLVRLSFFDSTLINSTSRYEACYGVRIRYGWRI